MRLALISDIHGNLQALEAVLAHIDTQGVDTLACLGDIVGYGADPCACVDLIRARNPQAVVKGNHDAHAVSDLPLGGMNPYAADATIWTREQLDDERRTWLDGMPLVAFVGDEVQLVHASLMDLESWPYVRFLEDGLLAMAAQTARFCFYGHTHRPVAFRQRDDEIESLVAARYQTRPDERWLVNVGSVGQPRDGDWRAAWTLLDTETGEIVLNRVEYDLEEAMARILAADLPERLARRLAKGT